MSNRLSTVEAWDALKRLRIDIAEQSGTSPSFLADLDVILDALEPVKFTESFSLNDLICPGDLNQPFHIDPKYEGCYAADGAPIRCWKCGSNEFDDVDIDRLDGWCLMEYSIMCGRCREHIAHWAHGTFATPYI